MSCELDAAADLPRSCFAHWLVGWMCSRSGPNKMVSGRSWSTSWVFPFSSALQPGAEGRQSGSLHFCVVLSFPHDTSCCYQVVIAASERAVFSVALLAKLCSKVQSASIRQYKDLPSLQWFSFIHNEVFPRFLVSSILLCHRMIGNTLLTPSIQPSSFGSTCSFGFPFAFRMEIHNLAFSLRALTTVTSWRRVWKIANSYC